MRCFVALGLEPAPGPHLAASLRGLGEAFPSLAVPPPGNLHLTLAFLGELDAAALGAAAAAMGRAANSLDPWAVEWGDTGAFPSLARPRVIWMGLTDTAATAAAYECLRHELSGAGIRLEDRPFRPHLTLARVRRVGLGIQLAALGGALEALPKPPTAAVTALVLVESRPRPGSPEYVELARQQL